MVAESLEDEKNEISISQRIVQLESAGKSLEHQLSQLPTTYADRRLQTELQLSQINQNITEALGRKDELILAPITGRVTGLQAKIGTSAAVGKSLLSIIPEDSSLEVVLLLPSSAIGFVEPGQDLRLMYDSFPYQQFGTQAAQLVSISEAPISARELHSPFEVGGPVYIARAKLASDTIRVLGEQRRLTSGMSLSADIILERRSLLDWLLEPLYSVRGQPE